MKHLHPKQSSNGISIKKQYGQHFLRDQAVIITMLEAVKLTPHSSVFEIGCGDGFLTKYILQHQIARLWVFEIDPEWAHYVQTHYADPRLAVFTENILAVDIEKKLSSHQPWILLANLPYNITFPILFLLHQHRSLLQEGVIMVQEEVAHKLLKTSGRNYGFISLFFQHYFTWKSLGTIAPHAFFPPPNVHSRLLHFVPKNNTPHIPQETLFWKFVKNCFARPRRTLYNNLAATSYAGQAKEALVKIGCTSETIRAQEMKFEDFLSLWNTLQSN